MKKLFIALLAFFAVFFVACGGSKDPTTKISFKETSVNLFVEDTYELKPEIKNAKDESVEYSLSTNDVVSINGNTVTALKAGNVTITANLKSNPEVKATLTITVKDKNTPGPTPIEGELTVAKLPKEYQGVYSAVEQDVTVYIYVYESKLAVDVLEMLTEFILYTKDGKYYIANGSEQEEITFNNEGLLVEGELYAKDSKELPVDDKVIASIPAKYQGLFVDDSYNYVEIKEDKAVLSGPITAGEFIIYTENDKYYILLLYYKQFIVLGENEITFDGEKFTRTNEIKDLSEDVNEMLSDIFSKEVKLPECAKITSFEDDTSYTGDFMRELDFYINCKEEEMREIVNYFKTILTDFTEVELPYGDYYEYQWTKELESGDEMSVSIAKISQYLVEIIYPVKIEYSSEWPAIVNEMYGKYITIPAPKVSDSVEFFALTNEEGLNVYCNNITEDELVEFFADLIKAGFVTCYDWSDTEVKFVNNEIAIIVKMSGWEGEYYIEFISESLVGNLTSWPTDELKDLYPEYSIPEFKGESYKYDAFNLFGYKSASIVIYNVKNYEESLKAYFDALTKLGYSCSNNEAIYKDKVNKTAFEIYIYQDELTSRVFIELGNIDYEEDFIDIIPAEYHIVIEDNGYISDLYHVGDDFYETERYMDETETYIYKYYKYDKENKFYKLYIYEFTDEWNKEEENFFDRDLRKCLGISNIMGNLPKYVEKGEQATIAGVLCDYYVSDVDGYKDEYWVACDTGFIMKYQYTMAEYGYSSVTEVTEYVTSGVSFPELPKPLN